MHWINIHQFHQSLPLVGGRRKSRVGWDLVISTLFYFLETETKGEID